MATFGNIAKTKTDAFKILIGEHRQIRDLFEELEAAPDEVSKQQIGEQILDRLTVHAAVERDIFYPAARNGQPTNDMNILIDEALGQHEAAQQFIDDLQQMSAADEGYPAAFRMLADNVRQHMAEEEHDIFPRAANSNVNWEQIGAQMQIRKVLLHGSVLEDRGPGFGPGMHEWAR